MIMFGIILMLLGVLLGLAGLWATTSNNAQILFEIGPIALNAPPALLFILGMVAMGLLWLGFQLAGFGTKRSLGKRRERRELQQQAAEQERALAETNARLGREKEAAAEAERAREEERAREAKLRIEADRRREMGREDEVRRAAAAREAELGRGGLPPVPPQEPPRY